MAEAQIGIAKLGATSGFRYIGFQPPLTEEQINVASFITPDELGEGGADVISTKQRSDSTELGFFSEIFGYDPDNKRFAAYALKIVNELGGYALDTTVREVGPGPSLIAQANGARPEW